MEGKEETRMNLQRALGLKACEPMLVSQGRFVTGSIPAPIIESKEEIVHTPSPGLVQEIQYLRSESRTTRLPRTVSDAVLQLDSSGNAGSLCSLASGRVWGEKGFDMKGSQTRRSSPIEPASTLCCGVLTSEC